MAIGPDTVLWDGDQIFWECQVRPRRDGLLPGSVSMANHPLGVGLTGRGVEHPPPLLLCLWLNGLR